MDEQLATLVKDRINSRLRELGMKQIELCDITGLSPTGVSQYCRGKRVPDTMALYKIASALQTSMEWLLTGINAINDLSQMENDLITMFRILGERDREDLFDIAAMKYRKESGNEAPSFSTYKV